MKQNLFLVGGGAISGPTMSPGDWFVNKEDYLVNIFKYFFHMLGTLCTSGLFKKIKHFNS